MPAQAARGRRAGDGTCIYCLETKGAAGFSMVEHVLPRSFGLFQHNLTLRDVVCDDCNQLFGKTIDLYLARDTPDGLNRYLTGGKDPKEFTPPHKSASRNTRIKTGFLAGAFAAHSVGAGPRDLSPIPQVGFGKSKDGPFEWFPLDQLPTHEQLETALKDHHHVYILQADPDLVADELKARGVKVSDVIEKWTGGPAEAGFTWVASVGIEFGRAITKIAFNYLAHEYGAKTALTAEFNTARRFVRYGGQPLEPRIWTPLAPRIGRWPLGHRIAIQWERSGRTPTAAARATVSFHHTSWYAIELGGLLVAPAADRAHLFDLKSMRVTRLA